MPLLTYAYSLEFTDRPDYEKMKFMLKKILMDRDYVPERKFDWSLRPGEHFGRVDQNDKHSSISSCCISSYEEVYDPGEYQQLQANIDKCLFEYIKPKRLNYSMLQGAKPG